MAARIARSGMAAQSSATTRRVIQSNFLLTVTTLSAGTSMICVTVLPEVVSHSVTLWVPGRTVSWRGVTALADLPSRKICAGLLLRM